jgi:hypothetical protein
MKAYKSLVKFSLNNNATVSVWDGEEWQVRRSAKYTDIINAIESVEVAELRIRDNNGDAIGWAQIIPFGMEDDETVADYSITPFMATWENTQAF